MCDMDYFSYLNDVSGENNSVGGDWYNWPVTDTPAVSTDPYSLGQWGITDYYQPTTPDTSSWYSGLGNVASGLSSILTSPDVWKYGGLIGSILAATQGNGAKTTTTNQSNTATPQLLPSAQAGVNEIMGNALPYAQSRLLNPMGQDESSLYQYLMGGGGNVMNQMTNFGNQAQGYLQGGLQDLDINSLLSMVAPQITEATMKQFGPYAATKGGAQLATTQALTDKAAEFAKQRSAYQMQAAGLTPQIAATQATIMPELLKLAAYPQTQQNAAYGSYMDTLRTLLGLPSGTAGAGTSATTAPETSIWQKLAPLFQGMSATGTPTTASSGNTNTVAQLLSAMLKG